MESEALNPVFIAQLASRLFNELPEAGTAPRYETDAAGAPSAAADTLRDKSVLADEPGGLNFPTTPQQQDFSGEKKQEPLGHHANKLTEQQNYSDNKSGSYGLDQFIERTLPAKPDDADNIAPFFTTLNGGLPAEDEFPFSLLFAAAQDPVALAGEKREAPKVVFMPVSEATPQFKNIFIKNVVCDGAEKAIFIRGLPEMNIHDIHLENINIISKKGMECSEAKNISLKNVKLVTENSNPVIDILNSSNIIFTKFSTEMNPSLMIRMGGDRTNNIQWINSTKLTNSQYLTEFGTAENSLQIK